MEINYIIDTILLFFCRNITFSGIFWYNDVAVLYNYKEDYSVKKKHLIASALSLGLLGGAIAVPSAIFADSDAVTDSANTSTTATQDAGKTTTGDHVITPQSVGNSFNFTVGGSATASGSFEVPKGFGYVKLRIRTTLIPPLTLL